MARFELRKSPVDGKVRRWDVKMASTLGFDNADQEHPNWDYPVQVCTGVFKNKKEALRAAGIRVR